MIIESEIDKILKKPHQQSRSPNWGGKRKGAGAPPGNTNAVKHGERSRRAFFPIDREEEFTPLVAVRIKNLLVAEELGPLFNDQTIYADKQQYRYKLLLEGIMGQHTDKIMRLEIKQAIAELNRAKASCTEARRELAAARAKI